MTGVQTCALPIYNGSAEEWDAVLSHQFLQKGLEGEHAKAANGVEVVSSLISEDELKIVIQKHVGDGGILVRRCLNQPKGIAIADTLLRSH